MPSTNCAWIRALAAMGPAFQRVSQSTANVITLSSPADAGLHLDGNIPRGICLYTPDETQHHYLEELELHRGDCELRSRRKASCVTGVSTRWAVLPPSARAALPILISGYVTRHGWMARTSAAM